MTMEIRNDATAPDPLPASAATSDLPYDAILIVGFGGPEGPDDVMPFLENVTRGRGVPRERLLGVAEHYMHFGGVSPINGQVREFIAALEPELRSNGVELPIYWGNRNWRPMLADTLKTMTVQGIRHALAVVLSGYSSYSGCRQYREDIARAREAAGPDAPIVEKMRVFYNHPDFIAVNAECVREAIPALPAESRSHFRLAFTAHSIPESMAAKCNYELQLKETCRLVAEALGMGPDRWDLVYQSRSGRPGDPWLEPDILDYVNEIARQNVKALLIHPVGFLSDHIEVLFDLDEEAKRRCEERKIAMTRSATPGVHPVFVSMTRELIVERITGSRLRRSVGRFEASHDVCPDNCCLPPPRPAAASGPR